MKKKSNRRKEIKFYMRQNLNTAHIARLTGMTIVGVRYYIKRYKPHMTIAYIKKSIGEKARDKMIEAFSKAWVGKPMKCNPILNLGGNK